MNFKHNRRHEEPEINLIPMIDVLLVILIFLMITTTYSKFSGLEINLPTADVQQNKEQPDEINVVVTASGDIMVNKQALGSHETEAIREALQRAAGSGKEAIVVINADAKATHQSVIDVMQAAQGAGLAHISFATQQARH
ncbi:MAG: biopolymer transporter ExbD [Betaproteobacteria bacterium HGW-Betaproteobacteria-11]|nr:MAG: biopolymer transporter ExbD [Betaproteobacteria bacterium HGW-Betaproteobacteria-11]